MSAPTDFEKLTQRVAEIERSVKDAGAANPSEHPQFQKILEDMEGLAAEQRQLHAQVSVQNRQNIRGTDSEVVDRYLVKNPDEKHSRSVNDIRPGAQLFRHNEANGFGPKTTFASGDSGVRMVGGLTEFGERTYGLFDDPNAATDWQRRLQDLATAHGICRSLAIGHGPAFSNSRWEEPADKLARAVMAHLKKGPDSIARVFSDVSGSGAELLPTAIDARLEGYLYEATPLEQLLPTRNITSRGTKNPFQTGRLQFYNRSALPDDNPALLDKTSLTFTERTRKVHNMACMTVMDPNAEADAIVNFLEAYRIAVVAARNDMIEDAYINGDSRASHQDTDVDNWTASGRWTAGSDRDHRKVFDGLRRHAFAASSAQDKGSAHAVADILKYRAELSSGYQDRAAFHLVSMTFYLKHLLGDTNVLTADKFKSTGGTIVTGSLGSIGRVPLVHSPFMSNELNASGVYDGVTTDKTGLLTVASSRFEALRRGGLTMVTQEDPKRGAVYLVNRVWTGLHNMDGTDKKNVHYAYNLET